MNTKFYTRRDSATTVLRKAGITPRDYDLYLTKSGDGVDLNLDLLAIHKATTDGKHDVPAKAEMMTSELVVAPAKQMTKATVSSRARGLILAGKSNDEVWAAIKSEFKLSDGKKHYPSWYRAQLRRQGKLT